MVTKRVRSKRNMKPEVISKTGISVTECYCRMCMKMLPVDKFYQATDLTLDKIGFMSVCKDSIKDMYVSFYNTSHSMDKTILRMCRILNVKFSEEAINATKLQIQTQGKSEDDGTIFGIYKSKVVSTSKENVHATSEGLDITFHEPVSFVSENQIDDEAFDGEGADLKISWGADLDSDDYIFLEEKLSEWKKDYSCQNKAELFLMKELCFKELELRRARASGGSGSVDSILKSMDVLLKSAALTPAQSNAASNGKTMDTWGMLIKQIEQTQPAEFYADKKLFEDFDKLAVYITNFIKRPMLNFWGASKSFELIGEDDVEILDQEEQETTSTEE